jgi:hypothetical protein
MIEKYGKLWKLPHEHDRDSLEASLESLSLREEKSCLDSNIPRHRLESKDDEDDVEATSARPCATVAPRRLALRPAPSCGGVSRLEAACIMTKEVRGESVKGRPPSSGASKRVCESGSIPATPDKQRRLSTVSSARVDVKATPSGTVPSTLLTRRATVHSPRPQTSSGLKTPAVKGSFGPVSMGPAPMVYENRDL